MKLSVIIPTFNEEKDILNCLKSLESQTYKNFEVLVVDDGSRDSTENIVKKYKPKKYTLKYHKQNHQGPAAARNKAALKAKGDVLVFVDADMTFDKDFLKKLVEPIQKGKAVGTFSKEEYVSNWDNVLARFWNYVEGWEAKKRHPKNYPDKQKVFRAISKDSFEKVGGFSKGGYTDDYTLYEKIGEEAVNAKGAVFYHRNPDSYSEIFNHAKWVGKREYKMGILGYVVGLVRSSLPVSIIKGLVRSAKHRSILGIPFHVAYDSGIFIGILEYALLKKRTK